MLPLRKLSFLLSSWPFPIKKQGKTKTKQQKSSHPPSGCSTIINVINKLYVKYLSVPLSFQDVKENNQDASKY